MKLESDSISNTPSNLNGHFSRSLVDDLDESAHRVSTRACMSALGLGDFSGQLELSNPFPITHESVNSNRAEVTNSVTRRATADAPASSANRGRTSDVNQSGSGVREHAMALADSVGTMQPNGPSGIDRLAPVACAPEDSTGISMQPNGPRNIDRLAPVASAPEDSTGISMQPNGPGNIDHLAPVASAPEDSTGISMQPNGPRNIDHLAPVASSDHADNPGERIIATDGSTVVIEREPRSDGSAGLVERFTDENGSTKLEYSIAPDGSVQVQSITHDNGSTVVIEQETRSDGSTGLVERYTDENGLVIPWQYRIT